MKQLTNNQRNEINRFVSNKVGSRVQALEDAGYWHIQRWQNAAGTAGPAAAAAQGVLADTTLGNGVTTTVTSGIGTIDYPRAVNVKGTMTGGSLTGNVDVTGTNIEGKEITERFALNDNATVVGTMAFASVTRAVLPPRVTAGDVVRIGTTDGLGADRLLPLNTVFAAYLNGARQGTAPTVSVDADEVEKCLIDLDSALNATPVVVFYIDILDR